MDGLGLDKEAVEKGLVVWLTTAGDWHLVSQGGETGEVGVVVPWCWGLEEEEEVMLVWGVGDRTPLGVGGPSGLLNRRVNWGVLVGVGVVWVGVGGDSFLVWGSIPALLAEKVGLGVWTLDRGEATLSGEKTETGEVILVSLS